MISLYLIQDDYVNILLFLIEHVHDYEEFPQFMSYDPAEETFSPLGVPQVETKSPFMAWISGTKASVFVNVYYQFFKLIADSVVSVFK